MKTKKFMGFIFLAVGSILQVHAQTFIGTPVYSRQQELSEVFTKAEVYRLQPDEITAYARRSSNGFPITLILGSKVFEWKVYEHDMLRPEARVMTMKDGVPVEIDFDRRCRTYIGYRDDMAESARFTISGKNFAAMIPSHHSYAYIQPLDDFIPASDTDLFVLYYPADLKATDHKMCNSIKIPAQEKSELEKSAKENNEHRNGSRTYSCRELQVTLATDSHMWNDYESVADIIDFNLTILYFMEPHFDDFDLDFWVEDFFIMTSGIEADNPWGGSQDVNDLLGDFGDWAYDYFGSEDIGHLWTTANLNDDGDNGTVGYASVGGACSDIGLYPWCLLENYNVNAFYTLSILQAHEYGHLLDADHEPGTGTIMEPNLGNVESASWAQANIEEMFDFMEDESCIQTCVRCPITYNVVDYIGWGDWRYSATDHINSTAVIDSFADVVFQAINYVKLTPGFSASSLQPSSAGGTFVAKIAGCE